MNKCSDILLSALKSVLQQIADDAASVTVAKEMFSKVEAERVLSYINANFCMLTASMMKLKTIEISLNESPKTVEHVQATLQELKGSHWK